MRGRSDGIEATLPGTVVGNTAGEVATVIAVDGVTVNSDEFVVSIAEYL